MKAYINAFRILLQRSRIEKLSKKRAKVTAQRAVLKQKALDLKHQHDCECRAAKLSAIKGQVVKVKSLMVNAQPQQ